MRIFYIAAIILLCFVAICPCFARKVPVEITPVQKITTSKNIAEGDYLLFKVLNNNETVRGTVTKYEPNGLGGKEALLIIDDFKASNSDNKYSGTIALNGNQHNQVMEFFAFLAQFVRGGEVTVLPDKDIFNIWMEK